MSTNYRVSTDYDYENIIILSHKTTEYNTNLRICFTILQDLPRHTSSLVKIVILQKYYKYLLSSLADRRPSRPIINLPFLSNHISVNIDSPDVLTLVFFKVSTRSSRNFVFFYSPHSSTHLSFFTVNCGPLFRTIIIIASLVYFKKVAQFLISYFCTY